MERLKNLDWVLVTLILLGARSIIDANVAQSIVVACFSAVYGFKQWLGVKKEQSVSADIMKELDQMKTNVAGVMMKNSIKPQQMQENIKRFF